MTTATTRPRTGPKTICRPTRGSTNRTPCARPDTPAARRNFALWRSWREAFDAEPGRDAPEAVRAVALARIRAAMDALVAANKGLIWDIARAYADRRGFRDDDARIADCVSEGTIGFMRGVQKFDPDNAAGAGLAHYAAQWIRQRIQRWIMQDKMIPVPVRLLLKSAFAAALPECRRAVGVALSVKLFSQIECRESGKDPVESGLVCDPREPHQEVIEAEGKAADIATLGDLLDRLDERERTVLAARYGLGGRDRMTLVEVGRAIGLSRGGAALVQERAMRKLRKFSRGMRLSDEPAGEPDDGPEGIKDKDGEDREVSVEEAGRKALRSLWSDTPGGFFS